MRPVLADDALCMGDNGRIYCGVHSGASARFTGRDISGQPVERVTVESLRASGVPACEYARFACEDCARAVTSGVQE